ncbi:fasciclin domain-containing protein [Larkinella soli]|uniref:fasciclin domain-containing protein n=1 Tax=Larkinella soli TaxID=1770527 RepID=UPI000FFBFD22|nr:fasciclin domain-containing protein [Larkinella soli]
MNKPHLFLLRSRALTLAALTALLAFTTSCNDDDDDDNTAQPETIADYVIRSNDFTILEAAVIKAGLTDALKNPNLTIFAPNDAAFRAAGFADAAAVNALTAAQLTPILQYHVLPSTVTSSALPSGSNTAVQSNLSVSGTAVPLYVTKNAGGVFVNGAKVVAADVAVSNGVMHVIDQVLMPPPTANGGGLVAVVAADTSLSLLATAATRVAAGNPALTAVLTGTSPYTVFAPTNAAFRAAGFATAAAINAAPIATLTNVLANHVVAGRIFSSDLTNGDVTAYGTGKLTVSTANGVTVKSPGITTAAAVTKANILATNGVVHKIDRVLLP